MCYTVMRIKLDFGVIGSMKSNIYIVTGHYGSGKTEFSVNFALSLREKYEKVILVDLDIVNPYFRSNDARALLESRGIEVISPAYAGTNVDIPVLPPEIMRIFEAEDAHIIIDVGGDDDGAIALGRYKQYFDKTDYEMYLVVNTRRPFTSNKEEIAIMKQDIEIASRLTVSGLVSNSNIADETTEETVKEGARITKQAALMLNLPVKYVCAQGKLFDKIKDEFGEKAFKITRYLNTI